VIAERRGQQVAIGIVGAILEQHRSNSMRCRSMHLAFDNAWIYRLATIVHASIGEDLRLKSLAVHFEDGRMNLRGVRQGEIAVLALDVRNLEIRMKHV